MNDQHPSAEQRVGGAITLANGRVVKVEIPVPFSPIEALNLIAALPEAIAQLNAAAMQQVAGRIALPNGMVHAVPKES